MDKRKSIGLIGGTVFLIAMVMSVSIVWAAYTKTLNVNGTGVVKGSNWKILFENLSNMESNTDGVGTTWAKEIIKPEIVGETKIETYSVQLAKPGDWISYKFTIHNAGTFNAQIDTITIPTPECTKTENGTDQDAINVCDHLEYTLTYADDPSTTSSGPAKGTTLASGDTLNSNESRLVELKLHYLNTITSDLLPTNDVNISNLGVVINYKQVD